jgi:23S rRNA (cytidine1920-2'-O)/16S rRNA (cytidine1409-2'-O)-methyltransferase
MDQHKFVSRGGFKLQAALDQFNIDVTGLTVLDVGSSTGGFTDCLLQNGAKLVYALDTAYGELSWKLRNDSRVIVMERTNILYVKSLLKQFDLITIDAGWTKLELVLPVVKNFLKKNGLIIALLKPHYQEPEKTKKGVIHKEDLEDIIKITQNKIKAQGFKINEMIESPIQGKGGNTEYLLLLQLT